MSAASSLADRQGRRIDYLRLSITDRCDLRCHYCIPAGHHDFSPRAHWLTPDEIERLVRLFATEGVRRIRLTGGEPLTRGDVTEIAARISAIPGIEDLSLSTNGTRLEALAQPLNAAGVRRLNVSLDSLCREELARITGRDCLHDILQGLNAAREAGFGPIKINRVLSPDTRFDDVAEMIRYCQPQGFVLRLIEKMPVGCEDNSDNTPVRATHTLRAQLIEHFDLIEVPESGIRGGGPARYLQSRDGQFTVGFITPLSQHFCDTCNRLRLGADGALYTCLDAAGATPLGTALRHGANDEELRQQLRSAVWNRPDGHLFDHGNNRRIRLMSVTGG